MSQSAPEMTKRTREIFDRFARYGYERAELAVTYILAEDPTLMRTKLAESLYSSLLNGGSRGEAVFALEYLLEVSELRAAESLRPSNWADLASHLPGIVHPTGGD